MRSLPLRVTVEAFDGRTARLATEGGHAFALGADRLPGPCETGAAFCLQLEDVATWTLPEEERSALARAMLNELLTVP
ncbi:MAG TPA: hypothetical protein VL426_01945 [Candidatus Binatia bacterium]|jgi:hypothetical protein|nr:hypothetical protein [Candidatus Binatia bacterium]